MDSIQLPADQADYWRDLELPDCWPDTLSMKLPRHLLQMIWRLLRGKVARVRLPDQLPGQERLPKYMLQEFHSLPNGNYSKHIAAGYAHSFDAVMLNTVKRRRQEIARRFADVSCALDIGCGGGHMARALKDAGIAEVWGLEPSPYLLQLAARENPGLKLLQGVAESIPMPDRSVDLVTACFVFHEIPPRYADQALQEIHRVLKPDGKLVFIEPSPIQLALSKRQLLKRFGWRGLYFRAVASNVFEPFLKAWHQRQLNQWLPQYGFRILEDSDRLPLRTVISQRL